MVAGFERYFQIARCFRDEDLRADRQPDFTQLDIEMSFVDADDVIDLNERLLAARARRVGGVEVELPMRRLPYDEAIARYGTDKPDLRFGLELADLTEVFRETEFKVFRGAIEGGGVVEGLNAGKREMSARRPRRAGRRGAQELGRQGPRLGLASRATAGARRSPSSSPTRSSRALNERARRRARATCCCSSPTSRASRPTVLGELRRRPRRAPRADRPGGERALPGSSTGRCSTGTTTRSAGTRYNHPFTSPDGEFDPDDPGAARAKAYDVVWNGWEIGGGSIRISDPEVQRQVFEALGIDERGGRGALRLPARGAALRRAAARRHRLRPRPDRRAAARHRLDPRRDRLPEDRLGRATR